MFSTVFAAIILALNAVGQNSATPLTGLLARAPAFPANCARNYTVKSGDFCDEISATQNVSTFQLAFVNSGVIDPACDNLAVGELLCLGITGQDCNVVHVVGNGDTCTSIADGALIPVSTLLHNNPNVNSLCTNIGIGEVLCTSSQLFNYTNSTA